MAKPPLISDAEWLVMQVLWDRAPRTAAEVVQALNAHGWSPLTVRTMLNRLVKKGALAYRADGKRYLYRPAVGREECVRRESRSFLRRVFAGAAGPMLARFVDECELSADEIDELQKRLDAKRRKR